MGLRPGLFLLQENMTLYDLIFKGGGFVDEKFKKLTYLKRAEIIRKREDSGDKEIIPFDLEKVLNKKGLANTALRTYDTVRIYSLKEIEGSTQYVSISGHVKRPGRYELFESNMRIHDLLFAAGGFDDKLFKSKTFSPRADLLRFDNDRITQSIISFNLDSVLLNKNNKQNILLLPGDEIKVYSKVIFNSVKTVTINGVVLNPGAYALKTKMTLKDLILESGGLEPSIHRYKVEVARIDPLNTELDEYAEIINFKMDEKFSISSLSSKDIVKKESVININPFYLEPYDLISIRPDPYFNFQKKVSISGEVLYLL